MRCPNTPFATRLSGSAKETELRIRSIFQWKKKRPPVWLFTLIAIVMAICFGLVSCGEHDELPSLALSNGGRVYAEIARLSDPAVDLIYESATGAPQKFGQKPYDPVVLDWSTVELREFRDVLGTKGVVFSYSLAEDVRNYNYYTIDAQNCEVLICAYGDIWELDVDDDGQREVITYFGKDRYLTLYQVVDGEVVETRINDSVAASMGLGNMSWVNPSFDAETGLVTTIQTKPNGEKMNRTFTIQELFELAKGSVQYPELFAREPKIGDPFLRFAGMEYQNVNIPDAWGLCMGDKQSSMSYYFFGTQGLPGLSEMPDKYKQQLRCAGIVSTVGEMIPEITGSMSLDEFLKLFGIWNYTYGYEDAPDQGWLNVLMDDRFTTWIHTDNPVAEVHDPAAVVVDPDDVLLFIDGTIELENYMICEDYWNEIMMAEIRR